MSFTKVMYAIKYGIAVHVKYALMKKFNGRTFIFIPMKPQRKK